MELVEQTIKDKIYLVRGQQVMLDRDLAEIYGVDTKRLNEQVKRNVTRFPEDFRFILSKEEFENLKSQFATSSWGGIRKSPYAFTQNGVAMLSGVLHSSSAIQVHIQIMRTFVQMRHYLSAHRDVMQKVSVLEKKIEQNEVKQTHKNKEIFAALKYLLEAQDPGTKLV